MAGDTTKSCTEPSGGRMIDSTRKTYLITLVICAIISTCLTTVIFSFLRTLTTPSLLLGWIVLVVIIIFTCMLVIFTFSLYVLVLMLGFVELRVQLLNYRLKSEQLLRVMASRTSRTVHAQAAIRRRQQSLYRTN